MAAVVLYGPTGLPLVPASAQIVEPTYNAARATLKPSDWQYPGQKLGHHKMALRWSQTANPGTGSLLSMRWAPQNAAFMLVKRIVWTHALLTTAFTTQQIVDLAVTIARAWTASDSGGTSVLPSGGSQRMASVMNSSQLTDVRTGAGSLVTAGTRALDGQPFAQACADVASNVAATGGTPLVTSPKILYQHMPGSDHEPVLAQNEGLVFSSPTGLGAAGVVTLGVVIEWLEASTY